MTVWMLRPGCPHYSRSTGNEPKLRQQIQCIVLHYTAGNCEGSINWFMNPDSKVSAHLVIDRDGTVYEIFTPDYIAWHAGTSSWRGKQGVNRFGYGIEMVAQESDGFTFTEDQYDSLNVVLWGGTAVEHHAQVIPIEGVAVKYGLTDENIGHTDAEILGHEHVSPGRKQDPGPHFDWSRIKQVVETKPPTEIIEQPQQASEKQPQAKTSGISKLLRMLLKLIQRLRP